MAKKYITNPPVKLTKKLPKPAQKKGDGKTVKQEKKPK